MISDSSERDLSARLFSRAAAAAVAVCCVSLLTLSPAATARPIHHGKGRHAAPGPAQTTGAQEAEQARAQQEAPAEEEAPGVQEAPALEEAPAQRQAVAQQGDPAQQAARARHKRPRASPRHTEGAKGPGRHQEGAVETGRPRESDTPVPTSPASVDPAGALTPTVAPSAERAASIASSTTTASATTPAAAMAPTVADILTQAPTSRRNHAPRSTSGARHGRASRAKSVGDGLAAAPATQLGAVPTAGSSTLAGRVLKQNTRKKSEKVDGPTPLTTTITRIVDVVPTPMRALIAALLALALALAVRSRTTALRARRLERQRVELLEDVGLLQAALLPVPPDRLGPVGTSAAYKPAAGPGAGGDFYDVFALEDGQLAVIVGDVSGHGRRALPHTALVRFTLRAYLEAGLSPREAVQKAGTVLERQLGEQFVTVVAATYNPRERVLVYACAGHPPPVVLGTDGGARSLQPVTVCSSPPIGVGLRTGTRQTIVSVPGRSQICFYTDGVIEARVGHELFGSERLLVTLTELGGQATASSVLDSVVARTDSRADDMAACLLRVEGDAGMPIALVEELELDREQLESERVERFLLACGVRAGETREMLSAARTALARAHTVVLELHLANGAPLLTLRRDHLSYLYAQHENVEVYR